MKIQSVFDDAFKKYGEVLEGYDFSELIEVLEKTTDCPADGTIYQPGAKQLEALEAYTILKNNVYGGMPIQIGYCNGVNSRLNCLEYHRDSEINIAADEIVLLVAPLWEMKESKIDTSLVEAFTLPKGRAVRLYETTMHYAPARREGGFRVAVVLPLGTNTEKPGITIKSSEDELLFAKNKWLVAHPASGEAAQGAKAAITGENIDLKSI